MDVFDDTVCVRVSDPKLQWSVAFSQFAHPAINAASVVGTVGPAFLLAATMFGFVIQLSNLVTEKELRLRQVLFRCLSTYLVRHPKRPSLVLFTLSFEAV